MSTSTTTTTPTIAFLGATGGVTNAVLVNALRNGQHCIALVRTPSKLRSQLLAQKGITEELLDANLGVVSGNALNKSDVKQTLTANNKAGYLVRSIVSGLGGTPSLRWNWSNPLQLFALDQPTLCGDAANVLTDALAEIYKEQPALHQSSRPELSFVATTGISQPRGPEDVPFWMRFLYHQILAEPHVDKRNMEKVFRDNIEGLDGVRGVVFKDIVCVRPTLLTGGVDADDGFGLEIVRAGREKSPAMGYTIRRSDVGRWMWEELLADQEKRGKWANEMVTLTY